MHSKGRIIRSLSHGLESTLDIHRWVTLCSIPEFCLSNVLWAICFHIFPFFFMQNEIELKLFATTNWLLWWRFLLHSAIFGCRDKLLVAPCGFDSSIWDPSNDKFLSENYCAEDMKGKYVCKVELQQQLGLSKEASTIVVSVSWNFDFDVCFMFCYKIRQF